MVGLVCLYFTTRGRTEKRLRFYPATHTATTRRNLAMKVICHTARRLSSEQKKFIRSYFDERSVGQFLTRNSFDELDRRFRTRFRRAIHFKVANRILQKRNNDRNGHLNGARGAKKEQRQIRLARHTVSV